MNLNKIYFLFLFLSVWSFATAQTMTDFPWLTEVLSEDNCCNNESVTVYQYNSYTFVYVAVDATCTNSESKLYAADGTCWCTDYEDSNCLETYDLGAITGTTIYNCGEEQTYDVFKEYPWLSSLIDEGNCCQNQLVEVIDLNTFSFVYVSSQTGCANGKLYFETGELFCADAYDYDCLLSYGFSNSSPVNAWTCGGGATNLDCMPTWYADTDGNGLGNPEVSLSACEQPTGYVTDSSDTNEATTTENLTTDARKGTQSRAATALSVECDQTYTLANTTYTDDVSVSVSETMESAAIHTNASNTVYKAGTCITLTAGFTVVAGSTFSATIEACEPCTTSMWCQDSDGDGLGNPAVSISACTQPSGYVSDCSDPDDTVAGCSISLINGMHAAFNEFALRGTTVYISGTNVVLETDGLPDHTSPYWSNTTQRSATDPRGNVLTTGPAAVNHPLFVEPTVTSNAQMAPGNIDDFNGSYTLTVSMSPTLAASSSSTGLGSIGLAVSGSTIYNDEEGPNVPLDNAVGSLDYTAAHTGPQSYHYHLETKAWSEDDEKLIGIMADGFFLYGRKCNSTGTYPTDLDASGGHTSTTQHTCDAEYHYHIQNDLYLDTYYILFPGDYQGTPANIQ